MAKALIPYCTWRLLLLECQHNQFYTIIKQVEVLYDGRLPLRQKK